MTRLMKMFLALSFFVIGCFGFASGPAQAETYDVRWTHGAYMRENPDFSSRLIIVLPYPFTVEHLAWSGDYQLVRAHLHEREYVGYVSKNNLERPSGAAGTASDTQPTIAGELPPFDLGAEVSEQWERLYAVEEKFARSFGHWPGWPYSETHLLENCTYLRVEMREPMIPIVHRQYIVISAPLWEVIGIERRDRNPSGDWDRRPSAGFELVLSRGARPLDIAFREVRRSSRREEAIGWREAALIATNGVNPTTVEMSHFRPLTQRTVYVPLVLSDHPLDPEVADRFSAFSEYVSLCREFVDTFRQGG